jgi:hypothetical protein
MKKPNKKYFSTSVRPPIRINVSGPCDIIVESPNKYGEFNMCFEIDRDVVVETSKNNLEYKGKNNEQSKT